MRFDPHMDGTICRDRLDALVRAGLLEDELQPNLRLFRTTEQLHATVTEELEMLAKSLEARNGPGG